MWEDTEVMKARKGSLTIFYVLAYESGLAVQMVCRG